VGHFRILSRASDLARLQAFLVGRALEAHAPDTTITYLTRTASGDRDTDTPLAAMPDKGAFTADLTGGLLTGEADLVVHSWKDLPLEGRPDTEIAATLERADPRDVLLIRRDVVTKRPAVIRILSSSPRRAWLIDPVLPELLPWPVSRLEWLPVRGNIATRLTRLIEGRGDALLVAKAALDRLLGFGPPLEAAAQVVRALLDQTRWMVLPTREVPGAPAQGALAIEIAANAPAALRDRIRAISHQPTWHAVMAEREILAAYGGGCHQAVGATVLPREYGRVVSVRARSAAGGRDERWSLIDAGAAPPRASRAEHIWPRPDERRHAQADRRPLDVAQPTDDHGYFVARADALPESWQVSGDADRLVWAAGGTTWRRLAARGVWVNGSAEGLGDDEPAVRWLAGRPVAWHRLTHAGVDDAGALATYEVDVTLPADLASRTHFFWMSGTAFRRALATWPSIRQGWHGSGPGRTAQAVRDAIGPSDRVRVWLDYDQWHQEVRP
jgi:hydroxymethylbilane synthase